MTEVTKKQADEMLTEELEKLDRSQKQGKPNHALGGERLNGKNGVFIRRRATSPASV